jgi:S1-C subfamily serine protease
MSEIDKLERLKKLLDDGAITEEEYNAEKSKLLSKKVSNTNKNISILLIAAFAFAGIYFLTSEKQEVQVLEAEIIDTTTTTEPLEELIIDESFVVDSIEDVISATVFINVEGVFANFDENSNIADFEGEWTGSGFLISSNGYIVTNQHVVSGASIVKVFFYEEDTPRIARVIATSECSDLALLKIDIEDSLYFEWAEEQPFVGKEIYAAGYPLSNPEFTLLDGIVTKKEANGETSWASIESTFEHNAETKKGNSGGPIVGKDNFKVYGVHYAGNNFQQEFSIKNSTAQRVINSMLNGSHMPGFGINGKQEEGYGLFLYSVDIGSPLDIAGLQGGDLITKLAGISLEDKRSLKTYCDILSTQTSSGKVLIEYYSYKNGRKYSTTLNKNTSDSSVQASGNTTTTKPKQTTTTTKPKQTTTTTTVNKSTTSLKLPENINEFPEIPYCKMTYEEVEKQLNDFFLPNNVKITIREYEVKTENENCHGYVSGGNYSYLDKIENGAFVEITVEGAKNKRKFPTTIANTENAKGNNEFYYVFCDLSKNKRTDKFWIGELLQPYKFNANLIFSQPNFPEVNLTDPDTNCGAEEQLNEFCFWRIDDGNGGVLYRNYFFDAINHYANQDVSVTNYCSEEEFNKKLNEG